MTWRGGCCETANLGLTSVGSHHIAVYLHSCQQVPAHGSTTIWAKPIPLFATRDELGILLESEGMKKGVEVGVQMGHYSAKLLSGWKSCEKFYLVDAWKEQENYVDIANVGAAEQEQIYLEARNRMKQWRQKQSFDLCRPRRQRRNSMTRS